MKILWITNVAIGRQCEIIGTNNTSGGWMTAALEAFIGNSQFEICVATTWKVKNTKTLKDLNIDYVVLSCGYPLDYQLYKKSNHQQLKKLISYFKPDIIHIHGTEFSLGLALMTICPNEKYIVSIQGLCSIIERYYYAGMFFSDILKTITIRDIVKMDTIFHGRRKFQRRGLIEKDYIKKAKHVIGRTQWDYIHSKTINSNSIYHFCNESLRKEFYNKDWNLNSIKRHTIFVSQSLFPYKGLHILLKALSILKTEYKDILVIVAGVDITKSNGILAKLKVPGYYKYLRNIINKDSLQNYIRFTGSLDAEQMSLYYQKSHVFVCSSSIENSSNSIGEAQLVGIPCVASYVGGVSDMIKDRETGLLYRFEEFEMLANNIKRIFKDDNLSLQLSKEGKKVALFRHDSKKNTEDLLKIYNQVININ